MFHRPKFLSMLPRIVPRIVRCTTAKHCFVLIIVQFLAACEGTPQARPPLLDSRLAIVVPARQLTPPLASTLEFELLSSPNDIQTRVDLIWYYRGQFTDAGAEREANEHVLWLIEHQPRSAVLAAPVAEIASLPDRTAHRAAAVLWEEQIGERDNAKDAKVLGHAGIFFVSSNPAKAAALLEKAVALDEHSLTWIRHLARAYHALVNTTPLDPEHRYARSAVKAYEQALAQASSNRDKADLLIHLSVVAIEAVDLPKAQRAANDLVNIAPQLTEESDRAVALHAAHVALGRVELMSGQDDAAIAKLREAADAIKDRNVFFSQLDLTLARALLKKGHKLPVLEYLDVVHRITRASEVSDMISEIKASMLPAGQS